MSGFDGECLTTAAELVARTRSAQGKPAKITDPVALLVLARALVQNAKREADAA